MVKLIMPKMKWQGLTNFHVALRRERLKAGLTQFQLADMVGCCKWSIVRLESGKRGEPSWGTVLAIATAMGLSTEDFKTVEGEVPPPNKTGRPRKQETE